MFFCFFIKTVSFCWNLWSNHVTKTKCRTVHFPWARGSRFHAGWHWSSASKVSFFQRDRGTLLLPSFVLFIKKNYDVTSNKYTVRLQLIMLQDGVKLACGKTHPSGFTLWGSHNFVLVWYTLSLLPAASAPPWVSQPAPFPVESQLET